MNVLHGNTWWAANKLVRGVDPRLLVPRVCQLLTNTDIQRQECVKILKSIMQRGFYPVPKDGMARKTGELLVKKGVLQKVSIDFCVPQYGKRSIKVYIANLDTLRSLYEVLQALKPPPLCVHLEDLVQAQ